MADHFQEASEAFTRWFKSCQPFLSDKIQLADLRPGGRGRGIVATEDLSEDEEIFSIARNRIFSTENSDFLRDARGLDLLAELDDPWLSLIVVMIFECLHGTASPWKAYFDVLPTSFDTLMFWEDDELAELQASSVKEKIGKASANKMFNEKLIPGIRSAGDLFANASSLSDADLLSLAHRMGSTIMAYAFDIEKHPATQAPDEEGYISDEDEGILPKGMIPMADMLNADATLNNARLFYEADSVSMRTIKPVKAGDELFNDYGPLPRADLLRKYGYVTDNYAQYDVVEIPTDLIVQVVRSSKSSEHAASMDEEYLASVADALDERGYYEDAYDVCCFSQLDDDDSNDNDSPLFPAGLQMLLYRLLVDNSSSPPPQKYAKRPSALSTDEQKATKTAYAQVLRARQAQYATTIEQDRRLLQSFSAQDAQSRKGIAVQVRLGEKLVLQRALESVLASSINGHANDTEHGNKRIRTT